MTMGGSEKDWNVIFDVGRVLIQWDVHALYRPILGDDAAIDTFLQETGLLDWNVRFDAGLPFAEGIEVAVRQHPRYAAALRAFDEHWEKTVPDAIEGSVAILRHLKRAGVPLYAITNFSAEKWPLATDRFPFLAESFIDIAVSGEERVIKPEAEIFQRLMRRNDLAAQACIFIDDSPANIAGARALGMEAILFTSPGDLERDLALYDLM